RRPCGSRWSSLHYAAPRKPAVLRRAPSLPVGGMRPRPAYGLRGVAASRRPGAAFPSAGTPLRGSPGPAQRAGHSHGRAAMPRKQPVLIHVLTRARAIHGALVATPGRQATARPDVDIVASAAGKQSM